MKTVQASFTVEFSFDDAVEALLFAELHDASCRDWWVDRALEEAYQKLPKHEYQWLEAMAI